MIDRRQFVPGSAAGVSALGFGYPAGAQTIPAGYPADYRDVVEKAKAA